MIDLVKLNTNTYEESGNLDWERDKIGFIGVQIQSIN